MGSPRHINHEKTTLYRRYEKNIDAIPYISKILLDSHPELHNIRGQLVISLDCRNILQVPFVNELLKPLNLKESRCIHLQFNIFLNSSLYSKREIDRKVTQVFAVLRTAGLSSQDVEFYARKRPIFH